MRYDDEAIMEALRQLECPHKVDVTHAVMERIRRGEGAGPKVRTTAWGGWRRYAVAAAACLLLALGAGITLTLSRTYDETQICNTFASVYDVSGYCGDMGAYGDMGYGEYLYEEEAGE